jgi:hypothetical protein
MERGLEMKVLIPMHVLMVWGWLRDELAEKAEIPWV